MATSTTIEGRTGSYKVAAAIGQFLRVKFDAAGKLIVATAIDQSIGQADAKTHTADAIVAVVLKSAEGTSRFIANAAFAQGDNVFAAAAGKVGPYIAGAILIGTAMTATDTDGDYIIVTAVGSAASGTRNFTAGGVVGVSLRVKLTSLKLAVAGITDREIGVIDVAALADLDVRPVTLRTAPGTVMMVANAALAVNASVYTAAAGKVGPSATTAFLLGTALTASAADGDPIEVLRSAHGDTAVA